MARTGSGADNSALVPYGPYNTKQCNVSNNSNVSSGCLKEMEYLSERPQ